MNVCQQCQQENPPQANFCNNCGANLKISNTDAHIPARQPIKKYKRSAERRQLTILFCDLVGSTPLSEKLDPEEFREVITSYHQEAEKIVKQNGGHIAQYLGDGLLVYFGYPEGLEDAAKVAVQTGLGILEAIELANKRWEALGKTRIQIRIGIHTGLVVVDDHLALGETVNIAARLEGLAPHNGLVITPQTNKLVQGWFVVESLGKHTLKGISEPMEIFKVLKESGAKTRLEVAKGRGLSPLVGRHCELNRLEECWFKTKEGVANAVLLTGEAGIGKSRLVDTLEESIFGEPERWITVARCSAYQVNSTFYPIIQLIEKSILEFGTSDTSVDKLLKLEQVLRQTQLDFKSNMSLFAEFLSILSDDYPPLVMSPFAKRQMIMDSITQVLLHPSAKQPVLLIIEDLHWADASTLEWLKLFIAHVSAQKILIFCTTRPAFVPDWKEDPKVTEITLERLSTQDTADICLYQTKGKDLPKEVLNQIYKKTEGVPLFIEELTKMIIESDQLVEKNDGFEMAGSLASMTIPSTLQDSLLARLDRLSIVKEIVQIGSVIGREFSLEMLNAIIGDEQANLENGLKKLVKAEILYQDGTNGKSIYHFKHALIQDAAYDSLLRSQRQKLHGQLAHALEHQFKETAQTQPELLAHHYTEAEEPIQAIPIWLRAGQQASQKNATAEAIAHLEKGISLLHHMKNELERNNLELDFQLTLGGTYVVSHGFPHPKVKETFNKARAIAQTIEVNPKLALILFNLLSYYMNTEDYEAHDEVANYMIKLAKDPTHGYWFELCASQLVGGSGIMKGELEKANRSYQRIFEIFDPSLSFPWELAPSGYIEVGAKAWQMFCLQIMGFMDQAKNLAGRHLLYAMEHKDSMTLYHIYTFPALYNLAAREWNTAVKILDEYYPIVRSFGDPIFNLTADVYYNIAKAFQGDNDAFKTSVDLINTCFNIGFKAFAVTLSPFIGEQFLINGEYQSALVWIDKIINHAKDTGSLIQNAELLRIKGLTQIALGEPDQAVEECFLTAFELSKKQSAKTYQLRAAVALGRLWQKQGNTKEAHDLVKSVYDWFTEGFDSVDLKDAKRLLNELSGYE